MAREVIRVRDAFYIRSSSSRIDVRTRVLKQGDTFGVFDRFGDIDTFGTGELGTVLSGYSILVPPDVEAGKRPPITA